MSFPLLLSFFLSIWAFLIPHLSFLQLFFWVTESPFPISPASEFLSYFEKLFSSISYFAFFLETNPCLYLLIPPAFLVMISRLLPSLSYFRLLFETYTAFHRLCTRFLELTSWIWQHFTYREMVMPYQSVSKLMNYSWIHTPSVVVVVVTDTQAYYYIDVDETSTWSKAVTIQNSADFGHCTSHEVFLVYIKNYNTINTIWYVRM